MKTHQQTKSLEYEASLINLKEHIEKRKEKAKWPKKCKGNCKVLLYWRCIKFFRSLTTDIYSLTLPSPSRLRQTLLDYKEKTWYTSNTTTIYNSFALFGDFALLFSFLMSSVKLIKDASHSSDLVSGEFSFYRVYLRSSYRAHRCGFVQIYSKVIELI